VLFCEKGHQGKIQSTEAVGAVLYAVFKMQEEKTAYVYEEKNGNCPCARGRREGERCDVSPEKMDYLAMSHSAHAHANCLCLAEGDLLSHGVRARQGSARAEATSQGPEDIAGALGGKPRVFCREGE